MMRSRGRALILALGVLAGAGSTVGCTIRDATPRGSRRDEDAIQHVIALYARRLSERDWTGVRALFWREATYAGALGPVTPPGFRLAAPVDTVVAALARSLEGTPADHYDVRILRTDLRQEGDIASAWVTVRRRTPIGEATVERDWMELLVLRRVGGEWRLLSVAATPWPRRR